MKRCLAARKRAEAHLPSERCQPVLTGEGDDPRLTTSATVQGVTRLVAAVGQLPAKVFAVVPPPNCETAPLSWFVLPKCPLTFAPLLQRIPKFALFTVVVFG
jgi:hypothetical protein